MAATTRRRIVTRARRTGFKPARRVRATPGLVVTAPDGASISGQHPVVIRKLTHEAGASTIRA